jgi:predicted transcriptional regulator YdeE
MRPQRVTIVPFSVLGAADSIRCGSETPELLSRIWRLFESHLDSIRMVAMGKLCYGVTIPTARANVAEYVARMEVAAYTPTPDGLVVRLIPAGTYAVFECPVDSIGDMYQHVFATRLPGSTVQVDAGRPFCEQYPEEVTEMPVRLHIPVLHAPDEDRTAE